MTAGRIRERFTGRIAGVGSTSGVRIVVGCWDDGPWCAVVDPIARVALRGVRTRGTAGGDRREWYGATSVVAVTGVEGEWRGAELGALAPVDPPCSFGFSSTPKRPSVTDVVTTIERSA